MICFISTKTEEISPKDFSNYQNLIELFKDLTDGNVNPKEVLKDQINFELNLGEIRKGNPKSKSKDHIIVIKNVENFFDLREKIIDFFRDHFLLLSDAKYKAKYRRGLKMLSPKQTLQRLPIALVQVKAGNISTNLLNEIRQIIYPLYRTKEIAKKVYDNVMNSIKL